MNLTTTEPIRKAPLVEVRDLAVSFEAPGRNIQAVDGVDLTIHEGQTLAVVGESGCGKSVTALSMLQLIQRPPGRYDRGSIFFRGQDLLQFTERQMLSVRGRDIAMIFQEPMTSLNPVHTVGDQIMEAIRLHQNVKHREARSMAIQAMVEVGIADAATRLKSYPHEFSGGMQQRVMIAMALACQPQLLLADEPTTALDVTIQAQILDLLGRIRHQRRMAVMLITHDLCVVAENADVVCVIYGGRVVEYARVHEIFERPYHPYTRALLGSIPQLRQRKHRLATVADVVADPKEFRKLPSRAYGVVPWWPTMEPPTDLSPRPDGGDFHLYEVEPEHWIGCWRGEYLANHPVSRPDVNYIRNGRGT
jgi:ABC-type dipeptide/oligopeptide/nickel transport system ATPase component